MNKDTNQNMALINAYRMDGLGNNFLIIDRRKSVLELSKDKIVSIANKKVAPFDQLITLEKESKNLYPIKIYNPDGIEIGACGNGTRCVAYLVYQENNQKKISIKIKENILNAEVVGKQNVKINMGKPKFGWKEIPLSENINTNRVDIDLLAKEYGYGFCVNIGNPHIVF
jgi:Diaminopimelate epimerase